MKELHKILKDTFGFTSFRKGQEDVIKFLLEKKSLLAIMPTGAGKSLCYQLPAVLFSNQTIVVSPLVALMDDQVNALKQIGVNAERMHSNMTEADRTGAWEDFKKGHVKIFYISPESLMNESIFSEIKNLNIDMFVIDEAHCISKWGADFRVEYEKLKILQHHFPNAVISAFTATADQETRSDINKKLTNNKGKIFLYGFNRPNISLEVQHKYDWRKQLLEFLDKRYNQSGIIYCLSRKQTEICSNFLQSQGFNSTAFHAGLDSNIKTVAQDRFMTEDNLIICATIAFGMGIDKSNVRFVVHISLPSSMEAFYQEIGRAGRDNKESNTLLIFGYDDLFQRRRFIEESNTQVNYKIKEHKRLDSLMSYCDTAICRQQTLLSYFQESSEVCGKCDNCLNPPELIEGTKFAQMILSAIYRTGQYFGSKHITDIIRGIKNEKVKKRRHDKIKTFGVGKDISEDFWRTFIRQLVSSNYLRINIQKFGALEITIKGESILKGEDEYFYRQINVIKNSYNNTDKQNYSHLKLDKEKKLLKLLKDLRLRLAKEQGVPAYIIFSDNTLNEMVMNKPSNIRDFAKLNGVGPQKQEKYAEVFMYEIKKLYFK